jgi:20S proteasome alpha/beta subunit
MEQYDYGLDILVSGANRGKASIYGIVNPGTSNCFDAVGFHAIGSGLPHAINTLISRECHQGISLEEGILITYEAKKMAEKSPGVGMKITNMSIVNEKGIIELYRDQVDKLDEIYKKWVKALPKLSDFMNDIKELLKK